MSTRIFDAYLYDKPEDDLLLEPNSIRDAYMAYLKADIKKDPDKWMCRGKHLVREFGTEEDKKGLDPVPVDVLEEDNCPEPEAVETLKAD